MTDPPATNLDHALAYARRGWRVVPVPAGRKVPTITAWQREGTTDEARIRHWWTQAPDHGIGIVCGAASGLWVLDVDVADGKAGDETLAELVDAYGALPDTYTVVTGSGGLHIYFAWDGTPIRNSASGKLGLGLDVRGEGGFVVAPPSLHASGNRYEVEHSAPDHLATAPAWLVGMLTVDEERPERAPAPLAGDRPGDLWAQQVTWDELLTADGWTKLRPGPEGEDRWVRPGKDAREGPSATVGYKGSDVLKVFTSSHPHLRADETYTKLGYLAATRFSGDHSAAASWLRSQGHGAATSALDLVGGAPEQAQQANEPWPDPRPLSTVTTLPDFPLETLPAWVVDHACAVAEARQVPVDMCAMLAIGALAAACTGRATVLVHEDWHEPVCLYLVVAMRSGAGKSPAEKAMTSWLRDWERDRMVQVTAANERAVIEHDLAKKKVAALGRNDNASVDDLLAAHEALKAAEAELIPTPRLIIDDATPEAVATMLAAYGERLAVMSSEADLFDGLLRGNPNQRPNVNVYLKAWSGDEMKRDRKGSSETGPESTMLANPLLSVSVSVQPSVLARLLTDGEMVGRGFAARFMVSAPTDLMGKRDQRRRFRSRTTATAGAYRDTATALASRWATWANPAHLRFDQAAQDAFEDFLVELEPSLAVGAEMDALAEWAAKLTASVARYAGLLHLAEHNDAQAPVERQTVERAIALGRYWIAHARAVATSGEDLVTRQAASILDWLADSRRSEVSFTDIHGGCRKRALELWNAADFVPAIELLVDLGWLRPVDNWRWQDRVGVKGQKAARFAILPSVAAGSRSAEVLDVLDIGLMGERDSLSSSPATATPGTRPMFNTSNTPIDADEPPPVGNSAVDDGPSLDEIAAMLNGDDL